jgi:hypothetical protein
MIPLAYRNKTPPCPLENTGYEEHCIIQFEILLDSKCACPYVDLCRDFVCVMNHHKSRFGDIDPIP